MDHNAIETRLVYGDLGCPPEPLYILLDLRNGKFSRDDGGTGGFDRRWTNRDHALAWVIGFENLRRGGWTNSPELNVDE